MLLHSAWVASVGFSLGGGGGSYPVLMLLSKGFVLDFVFASVYLMVGLSVSRICVRWTLLLIDYLSNCLRQTALMLLKLANLSLARRSLVVY